MTDNGPCWAISSHSYKTRLTTNDNMFEQLKTSVEQAIDHAAGNMDVDAKRIHFVDEPNPNAIRSRLDLTQKEFAELLGISLGTVRNWEQGRRTPDGAAKTLLRVAEHEPKHSYASPPGVKMVCKSLTIQVGGSTTIRLLESSSFSPPLLLHRGRETAFGPARVDEWRMRHGPSLRANCTALTPQWLNVSLR